jgi:hypothetical protein
MESGPRSGVVPGGDRGGVNMCGPFNSRAPT